MGPSYRYVVLALCTLAFAATMVARLAISPVVPEVTATFSVSTGAVGLALSGMWAAYAVTPTAVRMTCRSPKRSARTPLGNCVSA